VKQEFGKLKSLRQLCKAAWHNPQMRFDNIQISQLRVCMGTGVGPHVVTANTRLQPAHSALTITGEKPLILCSEFAKRPNSSSSDCLTGQQEIFRGGDKK
jgi:hypothetical protein